MLSLDWSTDILHIEFCVQCYPFLPSFPRKSALLFVYVSVLLAIQGIEKNK
jgi:hypothetical protein